MDHKEFITIRIEIDGRLSAPCVCIVHEGADASEGLSSDLSVGFNVEFYQVVGVFLDVVGMAIEDNLSCACPVIIETVARRHAAWGAVSREVVIIISLEDEEAVQAAGVMVRTPATNGG